MGKTKQNKKSFICPKCRHSCKRSCNCKHSCHKLFSRKNKKRTNKRSYKKGGRFYQPAGPVPGPIVGNYWKAPVADWPGVDGVGGNRNIFSLNTYKVDPQTMMKLGGGKKTRKSRKSKNNRRKRGGLPPFSQGIVNIGRSIGYNLGSASNELRGYEAPVNPLPWKDQLISKTIYV